MEEEEIPVPYWPLASVLTESDQVRNCLHLRPAICVPAVPDNQTHQWQEVMSVVSECVHKGSRKMSDSDWSSKIQSAKPWKTQKYQRQSRTEIHIY